MPTDLMLAPVGAGKTEAVLDTLIKTVQENPFAAIWVLLPTRRQEDAFRQRLTERSKRVYFNVTFFNFYSLYAHLLNMVGQPQRQLDDTARLRLLRQILTDLQKSGKLQVYSGIADTPGFVRIIADFVYELKQNIVTPDLFSETAAVRTPKDRDLSLIYRTYQDTLQSNKLVDREGEGWLALAEVRNDGRVGGEVALLLVDGFDEFNPLQAQLLALLSTRAHQTLVTLPTVPGRETTVGRRFDEAFIELQMIYERIGQSFRVVSVPTIKAAHRHPALHYLIDKGFLPGAEPISSDGCLALIEAPDVRQEVGAVLRRVKRLLLTADCQPDDILIAVRDWERYGEMIMTMARVYGVPVALHYGERLDNSSAIIALLNLLDLPERDFRRRDLLDVLRSPYFATDGSKQADMLERISQSQFVTGGRAAWLEAIERASRASVTGDDEPQKPIITPEDAGQLGRFLTAFFDAVTPPPIASVAAYVRWLEGLIGRDVETDLDEGDDSPANSSKAVGAYTLDMLRQIRQTGSSAEIVDRDLIALHELKKVLRSLFAAQNLFAAIGSDPTEETEWWMFLRDLKSAVARAAIYRSPNRFGRVLVTAVSDARGLPHRHVFVPGLSEGIFPAPIPEDPLYLDSERRTLTKAGIPLETQADRAADEGLFYELIGLALETLTLSRPSVQNGIFWPESHLWRVVRESFSDAASIIQRDRIALAAVVRPEEVASPGEAALVVAEGMNQAALNGETAGLYNWLVGAYRQHWQHVRLARQVELRRMTGRTFDRYSGLLSQRDVLNWVAEELGSQHIWSASQFNDYGTCGFRFFARRLLKLEKIREPEERMDSAQLGTLNHAILEKTYARLTEMGVTITPDFADQAVQTLHETAAEVLQHAPYDIGFRTSALWEHEKVTLLRKLEAMIRLDFSDSGPAAKLLNSVPRRPYRQEVPFSSDEPYTIELRLDDLAETLKVTGYIDRMDRAGEQVIVIDYKTGSTTIPMKDMQRGRNFQMMLYLLAGQTILDNTTDASAPHQVAGGFFWHLRNQKPSGMIALEDAEDRAAIREALEHLSHHIQQGRRGDFAAQPNKLERGTCSHYCEFNQFCRVSIMNRSRRPR
jgi:ATP-dependent helicase/nuclease subunit B